MKIRRKNIDENKWHAMRLAQVRKRIATMISIVILAVSLARGYEPESTPTIEDYRLSIALDIARMRGLNRDQAILMIGIYEHELAPKHLMKTYGYFGIRRSDHIIVLACTTDEMLFVVCADLCAQTIKKRCPDIKLETIRKFNHGYGKGKNHYPGYATHKWWYKFVIRKMKKHENILY